MNDFQEEMKFLINSEIRLKILGCLYNSSSSIKEIEEKTNYSYSSILDNINKLEQTDKILAGTGAKVICAFCNISNSHLANIPNDIDCDCLIAGNDNEAKEIATELINKLPGVQAIDCGILEKSRIIEKITPLLIGLNIKYRSHYGGLRITGIPQFENK